MEEKQGCPTLEWSGECASLLAVSIRYEADGSRDITFVSSDAYTGEELEDYELFVVWMKLAGRLAESKTLDQRKKLLCRAMNETACAEGVPRREFFYRPSMSEPLWVVEYDETYTGGDYNKVGTVTRVHARNADFVPAAFKAQTKIDPIHIVNIRQDGEGEEEV